MIILSLGGGSKKPVSTEAFVLAILNTLTPDQQESIIRTLTDKSVPMSDVPTVEISPIFHDGDNGRKIIRP